MQRKQGKGIKSNPSPLSTPKVLHTNLISCIQIYNLISFFKNPLSFVQIRPHAHTDPHAHAHTKGITFGVGKGKGLGVGMGTDL